VRVGERIKAIATLGMYAGLERRNVIRIVDPRARECLDAMWD
jgi:hypothetical protein